jgi:hypothetical protein
MLINYSNRQALSISGLTVGGPSLPQSEKLDMVTDS